MQLTQKENEFLQELILSKLEENAAKKGYDTMDPPTMETIDDSKVTVGEAYSLLSKLEAANDELI